MEVFHTPTEVSTAGRLGAEQSSRVKQLDNAQDIFGVESLRPLCYRYRVFGLSKGLFRLV